MSIKVTGSLTVEVNVDGKDQELVIEASEFGLEEGDMRHIGDGDYQYEALFIHFGDEFEISFQATNLNGNVTLFDYNIIDNVRIVSDDLSLVALS
jgi:hypothetical protein